MKVRWRVDLAAFFLAAALVRAASAEEARDGAAVSPSNGGGTSASAEKPASDARPSVGLRQSRTQAARKVFDLLARPVPDPERALSLTEEHKGEGDAADIKWPLARAFALARMGESLRAAGELETLARRLREGVGLEVRDLRFVTRVAAFGVYEEDGRRVFRPGDSLMAYAEVIGFACRPAPEADAGWRVSLEAEFTLENRLTGEQVAAWGSESVQHATRSEIRDLHVTRVIDLPDDLGVGEYQLKVEVRDALAEGAGPHAEACALTAGASGGGVRRLSVSER